MLNMNVSFKVKICIFAIYEVFFLDEQSFTSYDFNNLEKLKKNKNKTGS